jgi:membrane fusion protein, multidrug efflux system
MPADTLASPERRRGRPGLLAGAAVAVLAAGAVAWGVLSRGAQTADAQHWSDRQAVPTVSVVRPVAGAGASTLSLPGDLAAQNTARIFARVSGYIHGWFRDIGARVRAGELLATLDTPDLDQQVAQARADLASTQAQQRLATTTARRWTDLAALDAVSKQEADEKTGDLAARTAGVGASQAALNRLLAL